MSRRPSQGSPQSRARWTSPTRTKAVRHDGSLARSTHPKLTRTIEQQGVQALPTSVLRARYTETYNDGASYAKPLRGVELACQTRGRGFTSRRARHFIR